MATYPIGLINRNRLIEDQTTGCARDRHKNGSIPTIGQSLPASHRRNTLKMSGFNNIVTMHMKGKIIIEFSSTPTHPPSTPAAPTGGSSSSPSFDKNAGSSPPRQSVPVSWQELSHQERQCLHEQFLARIGLELAQEYVRVERYRLHEQFMETIANELAQEEDRVDSAESIN